MSWLRSWRLCYFPPSSQSYSHSPSPLISKRFCGLQIWYDIFICAQKPRGSHIQSSSSRCGDVGQWQWQWPSFVLFVQDGLYLKVDLHVSNITCGAWKRSIKQFGKISCRHFGCSVKSRTIEEALDHYTNCPMAPRKVNIIQGLEVRCWHAKTLRTKSISVLCIFLSLLLMLRLSCL